MPATRPTALCSVCGRAKVRRLNGQPWKYNACWALLPGRLGSGAEFSSDRKDRYQLWRRWNDGGFALWVLLNPSDADDDVDDLTIDKLLMLTAALNLGGLYVVNLDSHIEPKSGRLEKFSGRNAVNESHILALAKVADRVILAWGGRDRSDRRARIRMVLENLRSTGWQTDGSPGISKRLECVGATAAGYPGHPQRRPLDSMTVRAWEPPAWAR